MWTSLTFNINRDLKTEVRRPNSEDRSQKTEVRRPKSEVRRLKSDFYNLFTPGFRLPTSDFFPFLPTSYSIK